MGVPVEIGFAPVDVEALAGEASGRIVAFLDDKGGMDAPTRKLDRKAKGAIKRVAASDAFARLKPGEGCTIGWPAGLAAEALLVVRLGKGASAIDARKAGATIAGFNGSAPLAVLASGVPHAGEIALGLNLAGYDFRRYRTPGPDWRAPNGQARFMVRDPQAAEAAWKPREAALRGVIATRDLVNEPANVLGTVEFADRLLGLRTLGLEVEVLDEPELERLGMRMLLAVGRGSASPSKVVVLRWNGGGAEAPLALVGKGVVFDTGGVSIKPADGMHEMTSDMAGAGVVAGVMETLARRGAKANVVGLVGLVENMLDGTAQRPGDVVRSMKGDTVEVLNTDAEGRLVLADVLWYAQERFAPRAMIDLATLTGACVIALGHEMAALFASDDALAADLLAAARTEDEGLWRLPLAPAYDRLLESRIADMANVAGRPAGAITAAQFLKRFVREGMPWAHLDIAGTAFLPKASALAPRGGSGWGVRLLDRLIRDRFEA